MSQSKTAAMFAQSLRDLAERIAARQNIELRPPEVVKAEARLEHLRKTAAEMTMPQNLPEAAARVLIDMSEMTESAQIACSFEDFIRAACSIAGRPDDAPEIIDRLRDTWNNMDWYVPVAHSNRQNVLAHNLAGCLIRLMIFLPENK